MNATSWTAEDISSAWYKQRILIVTGNCWSLPSFSVTALLFTFLYLHTEQIAVNAYSLGKVPRADCALLLSNICRFLQPLCACSAFALAPVLTAASAYYKGYSLDFTYLGPRIVSKGPSMPLDCRFATEHFHGLDKFPCAVDGFKQWVATLQNPDSSWDMVLRTPTAFSLSLLGLWILLWLFVGYTRSFRHFAPKRERLMEEARALRMRGKAIDGFDSSESRDKEIVLLEGKENLLA